MKLHKKLYKAGKKWLVASIASAIAITLVSVGTVKADDSHLYDNQTIAQNHNLSQIPVNSSQNGSYSVKTNSSTVTESTGNTGTAEENDGALSAKNNNGTEYTVNNQWYLKDSEGNNLTGWQKLNDGRTVYYDHNSNDQMAHGEKDINNNWYHFDEGTGNVSIGFTKLADGRLVYYNDDGKMVHGDQNIDGHLYLINDSTGAIQTGWFENQSNKQEHYVFEDGQYASGEEYIDGHWYYFDPQNNDAMSTSFVTLPDGRRVYYNEVGHMQYGEQFINGQWYHFDEHTGNMSTGFTKLADNRLVYYNHDGQMVHHDISINGNLYLINNGTGNVQTGWFENQSNGQEHYVYNDGRYASGEEYIDNNWYYFDPENNNSMVAGQIFTLPDKRIVYYGQDGHMQYGEKYINGHWYNFNNGDGRASIGLTQLPDGRTVLYSTNGQMEYGIQKYQDHIYKLNNGDGRMMTGWQYDSEKQNLQYFNQNGQAAVGNQKVGDADLTFDTDGYLSELTAGEHYLGDNGNWCLVGQDGHVKVGFQRIGNRIVYYDPATAMMVHGEKYIDGYWYFFDNGTGERATNVFEKLNDGRTTFYDGDGHMVYGEQNLDGNWYYFNSEDGAMATGFTRLPDGRTVYYDTLGHMVHGWKDINSHQYYFDSGDGHMYRGNCNIDGKSYKFNNFGQLDEWGWPFPADGEGHFTGAQLFGVNPGGEFRLNGFHDGLDFGSIDHPGSEVHAIHSGTVVSVGYGRGIDWYVLVDTGEYLIVYQEAFSNKSKISVNVGQKVNVGDVIGYRDTSHLHVGVTRNHDYNKALSSSFINNGTWLNPLTLIKSGL